MLGFLNTFIHNFKLMGFRAKRHEFYEQLARSYESKEALRDFLDEEIRIASAKKTYDASRAYALRLIARKQAAGDQNRYSALLGPVMPASDKLMLAALDDAPDKPALLRTLAAAVVSQKEIVKIVKGKVIPPLLLLPGAFGFSWVLATKSIPIITQIAPAEVWTPFNQAVRVFAEFVAAHGGTTVGLIVVSGIFFTYQLPRWTGTWRQRLESVHPRTALLLFPVCPILLPLSIYRDLQVGLMFSSLAVMLQAGRTLTDALQTVRSSGQPWLKWHLRKVLAHLEAHPTEYTKAFAKGLLSPQLLARLSSQIRTNPRFDQVLIKIGTQGDEDIRAEVTKQAGAINSMLLMAGALLFVFMLVGQMNISQSLNEEMQPSAMMKRKMQKQQSVGVGR